MKNSSQLVLVKQPLIIFDERIEQFFSFAIIPTKNFKNYSWEWYFFIQKVHW